MYQEDFQSGVKVFLDQTEFSDSISLGPQVSLRATYDSEEGYLSSTKGFNSYSNVANGDTLGCLLGNAIESFDNHHGTGSSTVKVLCGCILKQLIQTSATTQQVYKAVGLFRTVFSDTCNSLTLKHSEADECIQSGCIIPQSSDLSDDLFEEEDTSWFFGGESSTVSSTELPHHLQQVSKHMESCVFNQFHCETTSDASLLRGLQHCLPYEWLPLGTDIVSLHHDNSRLALPMQLAGAVATHLWGVDGVTRYSEGSTCRLVNGGIALSAARVQFSNSDGDRRLSAGCLKQSLESLHVTVLHGVSAARSLVMTNSIVFGTDMRTVSAAMDAAASRGGTASGTATYSGVVVWSPDAIDFDADSHFSSRSALGTSQQARSVHVLAVQTVHHFLSSRTGEEGRDSMHDVIRTLAELGVSLLLCSDGVCTERLVDCCQQFCVAVFPMNTRQLYAAADLIDVSVVDDLSVVNAQFMEVAGRSLRLELLYEIPSQDSASSQGVDQRDQDQLLVGDNDHHSVLVSLKRLHVRLGESPPDDPFDREDFDFSESLDEHLEREQHRRGPVSVVLCASTAMMAAATKDRFLRCLHRVRLVVESNCQVVPGGGLPELVCSTHLTDLIEQRVARSAMFQAQYDTASLKEKVNSCDELVVTELLKGFQRALDMFVVTILTNNGATIPQALSAVAEARIALLEQHHIHSLHCMSQHEDVPPSMLEFVASLSNEQKVEMLKPVDLGRIPGMEIPDQKTMLNVYSDTSSISNSNSGSNSDSDTSSSSSDDNCSTAPLENPENPVLDATTLKLFAMETALSAVRQIMSIAGVV